MRRRAPLVWLWGLALVLAAAVAGELRGQDMPPAVGMAVPALPIAPAPGNTPPVAVADSADAAARLQSWADTILARPLFTRGRRPPDAPAAAAATAESLPRLTGIAVSPSGRSAIFAAAPGGRPVVAVPGDRLAGFVVQAIEPGAVIIAGPGGSRVLRPSFDRAPQAGANNVSPVTPAARGPATSLEGLRQDAPRPLFALSHADQEPAAGDTGALDISRPRAP